MNGTDAAGGGASAATRRPAQIGGGQPGSFARSVLAQRHPALIQQVRAAHPYGPEQHLALDRLLAEITDGVVTDLSAVGAAASPGWDRWCATHLGRSWFDTPFLWAESYFYRRLLDAVGYFAVGPWRGVDPFAPMKAAELARVFPPASGLSAPTPSGSKHSRQALLLGAVWGNRADLGFRISVAATTMPGATAPAGDLLADDSPDLWRYLDGHRPGPLCVVTDNAAGELLADLLLVDRLLADGLVTEVTLHVKPDPYFVSDALTADVVACLRALDDSEGSGHATSGTGTGTGTGTARRLYEHAREGRLRLATHDFWCSPAAFDGLPGDLTAELSGFDLVILKGDLNYRRLLGDRAWPASTELASVTDSFPTPVVALRTLKSDVMVGLSEHVAVELDATEPGWRTSGRHAVIQADLRPRGVRPAR